MSMKEAYQLKLNAQLDEWNAEIDKMKAEANKVVNANAQLKYYKQIKSLRSKQEAALEKLKELKEADEDVWEELKDSLYISWKKLDEAVKSISVSFKSDMSTVPDQKPQKKEKIKTSIQSKQEKSIQFHEDQIKDLTLNEAIILILVCAAYEEVDINNSSSVDVQRILSLIRKHPLFLDLLETNIEKTINKFSNFMHVLPDRVKPVISAAKHLNPELREITFTWAAELVMTDGVLTKEKKDFLDKYAFILEIDSANAKKILANISEKV